jgi:hypothetical protein
MRPLLVVQAVNATPILPSQGKFYTAATRGTGTCVTRGGKPIYLSHQIVLMSHSWGDVLSGKRSGRRTRSTGRLIAGSRTSSRPRLDRSRTSEGALFFNGDKS